MPRGTLGLRQGGRLAGRASSLVSTATGSATRKTENQKQGWRWEGDRQHHSQPSTRRVQTMGTRSDSGHSRVSARERPGGCIAKAVALTPWL